MFDIEKQYKEFEEAQEAVALGVPSHHIERFLKMMPEEKESYLRILKYFDDTGKDRL